MRASSPAHMRQVHMFVCYVFSCFPGRVCVNLFVFVLACMFVFCTLMPHQHPVWGPSGLLWRGSWSCSGRGSEAGPGQQRFLPTYTLIHGARPSARNSIDRPSWLLPKPPKLIPHFLSSIALEMGPALNIISPCALSLRLSLSRQREERSRGAESLFPLSSPLSKTTGSGSGFLEMSAFVCCVTAAALGRSSSDEVMRRLDEEAEWERREVKKESSPMMVIYFNLWFIQGKGYSTGMHAPFQRHPASHGGQCNLFNWCLLLFSTTASVGVWMRGSSTSEGGEIITPLCKDSPRWSCFPTILVRKKLYTF